MPWPFSPPMPTAKSTLLRFAICLLGSHSAGRSGLRQIQTSPNSPDIESCGTGGVPYPLMLPRGGQLRSASQTVERRGGGSGRLFAKPELRLGEMGPTLRGKAKTKRPQHRETTWDAPGRAITDDGGCKAIAKTMSFCHANNLHHPVGHLLSNRQKNRKIIQTCRSRRNFIIVSHDSVGPGGFEAPIRPAPESEPRLVEVMRLRRDNRAPVEHRFENHKHGYKSAWVVKKYACASCPSFMRTSTRCPSRPRSRWNTILRKICAPRATRSRAENDPVRSARKLWASLSRLRPVIRT